MITREQDFREVRRLLVEPKENRPTPDLIVSNLINAEQYMSNRANAENKGWSVNTANISSVVNQAEYDITTTVPAFGKALFGYRNLGNNVILPVPFTDFMSEFNNQKYEFWVAPYDASIPSYTINGEKLAFFRQGSTVKMRIFPIPEEVRIYTIAYAVGSVDWSVFNWTDVPAFPEFARYRQLHAAIATLMACEWEGYSRPEAAAFRQELRNDLQLQFAQQEAEFTPFLRKVQESAVVDDVGYFWE